MANRRRLSLKERQAIYNLTGGNCAYCGQELAFRDMQVDHVVPLCHGGADEPFNMFPACLSAATTTSAGWSWSAGGRSWRQSRTRWIGIAIPTGRG